MEVKNMWLKRLNTQLNKKFIKFPKVVKPMNKKTLLQDFKVQSNKNRTE